MKNRSQIEAAIRRLQQDHANVPAQDKDLYPEIEAINQTLAMISTGNYNELIEKLLDKRQAAIRKAQSQEKDKEYQKELANWYGIILADCGYQLPE